jgi:hypothetical protein
MIQIAKARHLELLGAWKRQEWRLIYRNHAEMWALAAALPQCAVADCRVFDDNDDATTFLLVTKAS